MRSRLKIVPGPYKGLVPYSEEDYPYFYGRGRQRRIIAANLKSSPVTTLYGPSGVGKSSVLAAGVVHDLIEAATANQKERDRIGHLPVMFGHWYGDYGNALAMKITRFAQQFGIEVHLDPLRPIESLCLDWLKTNQGRLLVILDQVEEFFLYHPSAAEQISFASMLNTFVEQGAHLLLSLREDQLALLDRLRPALPDVFANQLRIEHLDEESAREAIECPVAQWNKIEKTSYSIEPALVERLLRELQPQQMKLKAAAVGIGSVSPASSTRVQAPWLQIVMTRLWTEEVKSQSKVLRFNTLNRQQGVIRIAERHLDDQMRELSIRERFAAANLFVWLVTPSGTKVLYPEDDLIRLAKFFRPQAKSVLQKLSGAGRILEPVDSGGVRRYQIYHDQLGPAIISWRLRFLRRAAWFFSTAAVALGLVAIGLATVPDYQKARRQTKEVTLGASALASLERKDLVPEVRQSLALYAWAGSEGNFVLKSRAAQSLRLEFPVAVRRFGFTKLLGVAFSPNALNLVLSGEGESVWIMHRRISRSQVDEAYDVRLLDAHTGPVIGVAIASKYLVTGSSDGIVRIYDPETCELKRELKGHKGPVIRVAINENQDMLASAGIDTTVRIWEPGRGRLITTLTGHKLPVNDIAFNTKKPELASADAGGLIAIWDTTRWNGPELLISHKGPAVAVSFSTDGLWLASGGADRYLRLWGRNGSGTWEVMGQALVSAPIFGLGFDETGSKITTGLTNGKVQVWNSRDFFAAHKPLSSISTNSGVNWLAVSSGGTRIATVHDDGTYHLWHAGLREIVNLPLNDIRLFDDPGRRSSIVPVGNLKLGILGLWDAGGGHWVRLQLLRTPLTGFKMSGTDNESITPRTAAGSLTSITPMGPIDASALVALSGNSARLLARDNSNALEAARKAFLAGLKPLTDRECRDLLGVTPCPPLPAP